LVVLDTSLVLPDTSLVLLDTSLVLLDTTLALLDSSLFLLDTSLAALLMASVVVVVWSEAARWTMRPGAAGLRALGGWGGCE
jgi:hypothetical protein